MSTTSLRTLVPRGLATWESVQSTAVLLGTVPHLREILPYPSTLVGSFPLPSSYLGPTTFKRNHDKLSYYLKFSAIPLREIALNLIGM